MSWLLRLVLLAGMMGCGIEQTTKRGQSFATQVVWQQQYLMGDVPPPPIFWIEAAQLNCADMRGWDTYPMPNVPECVAGLFYPDTYRAFVAWPAGTESISDTSFAHELCHAFSYDTTGDGDAGHVGPCFKPGGYLESANEALVRLGL